MWDDLIVFLVFAAIAGIQLLVRFIQARKQSADQPPPRSDGRPDPASAQGTPRRTATQPDDEEERVRKFLEALGIPTEAPPPPPIVPQAAPEPPPLFQPPQLDDEPTFRRPVVVEPPPLRQPAPAKRRPEPEPIIHGEEGPRHRMAPAVFRDGDMADAPQPMSSAAAFRDMDQTASSASAYAIPRSSKTTRSHAGVRTLLSDRRTLRDAIILREVLGPPKALL